MVGVNTWNFKLAEGETAVEVGCRNRRVLPGMPFNLDFDTAGFNAATVIAAAALRSSAGGTTSATLFTQRGRREWDLGLQRLGGCEPAVEVRPCRKQHARRQQSVTIVCFGGNHQ